MHMNRRGFLQLSAAGLGTLAAATGSIAGAEQPGLRALAFDAFPVFDPRPVYGRARQLFPEQGEALAREWRTRQFEYQWLRALAGQYADFWQATESALDFAARQLKLELKAEQRDTLMQGWLELRAWPDALPTLQALKTAGIRLAFLSNATPQILEAGIRHSGLGGLFEQLLSTDRIRSYKPDPRAYRLGMEALGLQREAIGFVAFAGWDAAGAKWFGYPTYWANRLNAPAEALGAQPDRTAADLGGLAAFAGAANAS